MHNLASIDSRASTLLVQLQAERAHAGQVWAILNELRLHDLLPDWGKSLDAGTAHQADAMRSASQAFNATLFSLIPGLKQLAQSASHATPFDKPDL